MSNFTPLRVCYDRLIRGHFLLVPKKLKLSPSCLLSGSKIHEAKNDNLLYTTVIHQDGINVQELSAIVKKVSGNFINSNRSFNSDEDDLDFDNLEQTVSHPVQNSKLGNDIETKEIIEGLKRCYTPKGVFVLLETIPENEVTAQVALEALEKIIELENNQQYRNLFLRGSEEKPENFARNAIFNQLINICLSSSNIDVLLKCIKILHRVNSNTNIESYRNKLCEKVLIKSSDGRVNILQLCDVARTLVSFSNVEDAKEMIDKLWMTLSEKRHEINETNISEVFKLLPLLKQSQKMVLGILEKRVIDLWWKMNSGTIVDILSVLVTAKLISIKILQAASCWLKTNVHTVSEDDLFSFVSSFISLQYTDINIENALERYVKAKGLKVKNSSLLAGIMDYCAAFRYRSHYILNCCGEYIIRNGKDLSPIDIKSMFIPFGLLDYHPQNRLAFWKALEEVLEEKFAQFRPEDMLDIMLTCIYLEKYPINFVKRIFNPYFIDRLHSQRNPEILTQTRMKLKLFDTAMSLECSQYGSPMLPRDHSAKSLLLDGRVKRAAGYVEEHLLSTLGRSSDVTTNAVLPELPVIDLYVVDLIIHPRNMGGSLISFNLSRDHNLYVAVLINLPEHYCAYSQKLTGPQMMRRRHFRKLGFKVANLDFLTLMKLRVYPKEFNNYIAEQLKMAEDAFTEQ